MVFEERNLPDYVEPVSATTLQKNEIYFLVQYADDDLLVPSMQPLVFVGWRENERGDRRALFQDIDSHRAEVRFETATDDERLEFLSQPEDQLNAIFEFEKALDNLMRCSLRRRGRTN
jgi:hypothetical protein